MRAVNFVERLQWDVPGHIFRHGLAIGDVDNDGDNELVVGTSEGDLYIFKGTEIWHKTAGLGLITCVAIGDIFNYGRNALVVVCGDGWVHIFYSPRSVKPNANAANPTVLTRDIPDNAGKGNVDQFINDSTDQLSGKMECVHMQRIPTNTKVILVADVDRDGANEMIIGLTDRVVRSYRWSSNADLGTGKLVGLNKWECANQIGTVTLQHMSDGTPTLLVAQPGGTFMRIKCHPDDSRPEDNPDKKGETAASCVDYQTLGISRMRNPKISTEIIGDLEPGTSDLLLPDESPPKFIPKAHKTNQPFCDDSQMNSKTFKSSSSEFRRNYSQPEMRKRSLDESSEIGDNQDFKLISRESREFYSHFNSSEIDQVDGNLLGGNVILGGYDSTIHKKSVLPTYEDFSRKTDKKYMEKCDEKTHIQEEQTNQTVMKSKPYALATLDGTIMLVKDEIILWAMQVDHQIFALSRLDVTGTGSDEIVVCAWDGQTYILDQERHSVRFQFEEPVRSFCTGNYSLTPGTSTPSLVYSTFTNKIFLYHDVILPSILAESFKPFDTLSDEQKVFVEQLLGEFSAEERDKKMQQLTEYLLYGMKIEKSDNENMKTGL